MIGNKFNIGDVVSFETEVMYAKLLPAGHTEVTEVVDATGTIIAITHDSGGFYYDIELGDDTIIEVDGLEEVSICEHEVIDIDLSKLVNEMIEAK